MPAEFLNLANITVGGIKRRRNCAVADAMRRHLFSDTSFFAVADNNLADAVASEPMTHIRKVEGRE